MANWKKRIEYGSNGVGPLGLAPVAYDVIDTVVVRTVRKRDLLADKARLLKTVAEINADLAKIKELETIERTA